MELWYLRSSLLTTNRFNAYVVGWFVIFSKSFRNCKNWHSVPFFFVSEVKEWTDQTATSQPTNQPKMQCNASTYLHAYNTIRQWMETSSSPHSLRNWIVMLFPSNFLLANLLSASQQFYHERGRFDSSPRLHSLGASLLLLNPTFSSAGKHIALLPIIICDFFRESRW